MTSPFDASNTQQIPRSVMNDLDDGETTAVVSSAVVASAVLESDGHHLAEAESTSRLDTPAQGIRRPAPGPRMPDPRDTPAEVNEIEELDGLIPTTTQRSRSTLSQRLDGI
ncbi:hypothetical protein [Amycolatopsis antarctica]